MASTRTSTPSTTPSQITKADLAAALGMSESELDQVVATVKQQPATEAKATPAKKAATPKQTVEDKLAATLETSGLTFHRGRVYLTKAIIEASARIANRKTDGAEVVASDKDDAVTAAVAIVKSGDKVYAQNLKRA